MAVPLCLKQNVTATAAAQQVSTHTLVLCTCEVIKGDSGVFKCVLLCLQILEETYKLEFLYSGLESRQVATIHHVRLQAKALQLILTARTRQGSVHTHSLYI